MIADSVCGLAKIAVHSKELKRPMATERNGTSKSRMWFSRTEDGMMRVIEEAGASCKECFQL